MTNNDRHLLEVIERLTKQAGQPPTFAEVAVGAGLRPTSRGAIYRRLSRMRGTHVDWESGSFRSLRLRTNSEGTGELLPDDHLDDDRPLGQATASGESGVFELVRLLATGLVQGWGGDGDRLASRCPEALRRGLSRLAVISLQQGKEFPRDIPEAFFLFRQQMKDWPLPLVPSALDETDVLIIDDIPSDVCFELAVDIAADSGELILSEITEEGVLEFRERCKLMGRPDVYNRFRRFLIEHPLLSAKDLALESIALPQRIRQLFEGMYEDVPDSAVVNGQIEICGFCGWSLSESRSGRRYCATQLCSTRTNGFGRIVKMDASKTIGGAKRVKPGIARYVVIPGLSELRLERRLAGFGLQVSLWPNFDTFDLHLGFPSGEKWAVDVKDWANPYLLGNAVREFSNDPPWSRAFLVVPNYRATMRNRYARAFEAARRGRAANVEFAVERQFISAVKQCLNNGDRHA